jgi:Tfp pilus assembly protein PilP
VHQAVLTGVLAFAQSQGFAVRGLVKSPVVGPKGNWAMVRDSKGVGHVIQKGTPMGTNGGVVLGITDKEVTIREEQKDFRGKVQYKDIAKKLPGLLTE